MKTRMCCLYRKWSQWRNHKHQNKLLPKKTYSTRPLLFDLKKNQQSLNDSVDVWSYSAALAATAFC